MAAIFITGGTGFIGSHIVEQLLQEGHTITVLTTSSTVHPNLQPFIQQLRIVRGNFGDRNLMQHYLKEIDILIHLAWSTVPKDASENPAYDAQTNIIGSINLLHAAVHNQVKRVIFISTGGALYGIPQYTPLDEQHPLRPISAYGISKMAFERYLHFFYKNKGLDYIILRVSNAYGPRQNITKGQGVIGIWLHKYLQNEAIEIWGDGETVRDYIYVTDIATAVQQALAYQGEERVFNLGSGQGQSLNQLVDYCQKVTQKQIPVHYKEARSFDVPVNVLAIQKIKKAFDWQPTVGMEEGMQNTWQWMLQQNKNP